MTRPLPLAILALVFMWLAANVPTVWMWVITVVALAALAGLIIAMRFRNMYVGPKTLVDDARMLGQKVMRDRGGEADRLEQQRERDDFFDENEDLLDPDTSRTDRRNSADQ